MRRVWGTKDVRERLVWNFGSHLNQVTMGGTSRDQKSKKKHLMHLTNVSKQEGSTREGHAAGTWLKMSPLRVKRIAPTGTERIGKGWALKARRAKREHRSGKMKEKTWWGRKHKKEREWERDQHRKDLVRKRVCACFCFCACAFACELVFVQ